jgi:hypothetical protein
MFCHPPYNLDLSPFTTTFEGKLFFLTWLPGRSWESWNVPLAANSEPSFLLHGSQTGVWDKCQVVWPLYLFV